MRVIFVYETSVSYAPCFLGSRYLVDDVLDISGHRLFPRRQSVDAGLALKDTLTPRLLGRLVALGDQGLNLTLVALRYCHCSPEYPDDTTSVPNTSLS